MVRGRPSRRFGSKRRAISFMSYTTVRLVGRPRARHAGQPLNIGPTAYSLPQRMHRSASRRVDAGAVLEDAKVSRPLGQNQTAARAHDDGILDVQRAEP